MSIGYTPVRVFAIASCRYRSSLECTFRNSFRNSLEQAMTLYDAFMIWININMVLLAIAVAIVTWENVL
jgi:hypothetical protein